jgi:hypothetical protein
MALQEWDWSLLARSQRHNITTIGLVLLGCLLLNISGVQAADGEFFQQQKMRSHLLVDLLLEKVDEGEFEVFGQTLTRDDLQPHQVAYVHHLADDSISISITFNLNKPVPVPNYENFYAHQICVKVDKDGNIEQVATHVTYPEGQPIAED